MYFASHCIQARKKVLLLPFVVGQVYGDGFRLAKAAYDAVGLDMLLHHVKCYQSFPVL